MNDLMQQMSELSGIGADMLSVGLIVFMRVGAFVSIVPAFGEHSVPQRVRILVALAFTAIVGAALQPTAGFAPLTITALTAETVVGLMLGMGLRLFVLALQTAGAMAAQATTLSQMFGGVGLEPQPSIGNLLVMAGLAIAVTAGLHVRVAELLILSYQVLPVGRFPNSEEVAGWGLQQISAAFALAFTIAAPFSIAALLYNIALGFINRALPALMVSFIGAPALLAGGLFLMVLVAPAALAVWSNALQAFMAAPFLGAP